jgi:outer membrane protein OmpA-like peptidoglycan-associated protein
MLCKSLRLGAVAVPFAAIVLGGSALAQSTPGQFTPDAGAPIQLHMPVHLHLPPKPKTVHRHKAKPAASATEAQSSGSLPSEAASVPYGTQAPTPAPRQPAKMPTARPATTTTNFAPLRSQRRKAVQEVLAAPANASSSSDAVGQMSAPDAAIPFSFDSAATPAPTHPEHAKSQASAAPKSKQPSAAIPEKQRPPSAARPVDDLAALTPPPKQTPIPEKPKADPHAGLTKETELLFDGTSTDPQPDGANALKSSTDKLNTALDKGAANVEIEAYAGAPGDKSSEARRLSLRRALAVRQLLIDGGIPASRIVVKAMGGAADNGSPQRVDVYLRGAS